MCGLAGIARVDGGALDDPMRATVRRMTSLVAHRGPDDSESLLDGPVGLAFTRLSLVAPERGGQPLVSPDRSVVLIANGEIYNHRELAARLPAGTRMRTDSDCEVLLHLYQRFGLSFLDNVRGMFALVLWDRARGKLIFARDRFGIKPLYFHADRRRIVFGSEIKALFADPATPRELSWEGALTNPFFSIATYLTDEPPATVFAGIEIVGAGTIREIELSTGDWTERRYWRFPGEAADLALDDAKLISTYGELLAESVAECATADAELGLFLSGGVDSAAVAALAVEAGVTPHTFTVLSGSTYHNGDAEYGRLVADRLGLPNHQVLFDTDRVPDAAEWKRLVWLFENPMCGPEVYYKHELHRYAKTARPELRGMLLGAASDEFNGGYSVDLSGDQSWPEFLSRLRAMTRAGALRRCPDLLPWSAEHGLPLLTDAAIERIGGGRIGDAYQTYLRSEYHKIQQYNCWHEDRTAAGSGIEARVPFLDHRLVEFVAGIPAERRAELLWDKRIMRAAVRQVLPAEVVDRPKVPFFHGDGVRHTYRMMLRMLAADGAALLDEALSSGQAREFVDADSARALLDGLVADPTSGHLEVLLRLVNLGLLEQLAAKPPAPLVSTPVDRPAPPALTVTDWDAERAEIERRTIRRPPVEPHQTPAFAENVVLLRPVEDADTCYVAVDGQLEFVVERADAPAWLAFLSAVDGRRSLAEVLAAAGCAVEDVVTLLAESVEHGLLTLDPVAG